MLLIFGRFAIGLLVGLWVSIRDKECLVADISLCFLLFSALDFASFVFAWNPPRGTFS